MSIPVKETSPTGIEYGGENFTSTKDVNDNINRRYVNNELKELEPGKQFGDLFDPKSGFIYTYDDGRWNIAGKNDSGLDSTDPAFDDQTTWYDDDKYDEQNGIL
ncbi:hypothetical protein D3870_21135 [Noviherbaspirillum cavernae]|uniref:Uncharacterized protein n=1 Tax=Noviherbaspirillum cavernae TaxID=2320862 RepID=A0A418WW54_9BURK|nr:hypothetical protein [Noviherbaspirillum cavernae]RJF96883.1 hypothetical protein D3870_21135 [Noviherbaspirillum cavernae]